MDFCCWCVGKKKAAELTAKGQTGGICQKHLKKQLEQINQLRKKRGVNNEQK
jgi:hypothetical protein